MHPARAQRRKIFLRRGMLPHVYVHRRSNDDRSFCRQIQCAEKILSNAMREFPEDVGGGRRDQKKIDALRDGNMFNRALDVCRSQTSSAEHIGDDFLSGECCEGERSDKFLRGARHHHLHVQLFLLQAAHKFSGFVSRNASGDAQRNLHRIGGGRLLAPLSVLVFILGAVYGFFRFVFEETLLQFFFGDARRLARKWVINHWPPAHHQLPGAARRYNNVGKLAIRWHS